MKKLITYLLTLLAAVTLSLAGISTASWFGSDDKPEAKTDIVSPAARDTASPPASEKALPAGKQLTLSGMIDENSQFVDTKGEIFNLTNDDKGKRGGHPILIIHKAESSGLESPTRESSLMRRREFDEHFLPVSFSEGLEVR